MCCQAYSFVKTAIAAANCSKYSWLQHCWQQYVNLAIVCGLAHLGRYIHPAPTRVQSRKKCISWQKLPSCSHQRTLFSWLLNSWQRNRKPSSKSLSLIKFTTSAHLATFTLERAFWSFFKSAKHFPPPLGGTFPPWLSCFHPQRRNGSCSLPLFQRVRVMGPSLSRCFKLFLKLCCSN